MRVINSKSDEIKAFTGGKSKEQTMTIHPGRLYLSKNFCLLNGLTAGNRISFLNDEDDWKFYMDESEDGFLLIEDKRQNGSLHVFNAGITSMIKKTTGLQYPITFRIYETTMVHKGKKLFWLKKK